MARTLQRGLTPGQGRLLERHRRGVARVATTLASKFGCEPDEVIVMVAHRSSRIGGVANKDLDMPGTTDVIVIPGVLRDLPRWIARLALAGPVNDCTVGEDGIVVIVIDEHGEMALCKVECTATAASVEPGNRSVMSAD